MIILLIPLLILLLTWWATSAIKNEINHEVFGLMLMGIGCFWAVTLIRKWNREPKDGPHDAA